MVIAHSTTLLNSIRSVAEGKEEEWEVLLDCVSLALRFGRARYCMGHVRNVAEIFFEHSVCSSNNTQYAKTHRSDAVLPISYNPVPLPGDDRTIRKIGLSCQMTIKIDFKTKTCQGNVLNKGVDYRNCISGDACLLYSDIIYWLTLHINEKTVDLCIILSIIEPNTNLRENGILFFTTFYELLWYSFGEYKGS